ncbi:type I-E CRISPR-associated protein Cse2/CasB [Leptolyngbya sp. GB1-A1]|uniref:type I-E CRISPR-associated protein Cse2/CasB n=1 Tax=Leptolyngbya sp. GB1-A1 TaxID=2933908 RepID=UPI00329754B9
MTTTQSTPRNRLEYESRFLKSVSDRIKNDNGAKADFKRALSCEPEHIRKVYPVVLPYVGNTSEWEQTKIWIPVACLSVYYPSTQQKGNFGHSCRGLATATNSEGADRRFRTLLDLTLTDIQSPLTALVRQMKSKGIAINYPQLLADLRQWEHPNQYIQDRWARAFWGAPPSSLDESEPAADDIAE